MSRLATLVLVAATLATPAAQSWAQTNPAQADSTAVDPGARELIEKFRAAVQSVNSLSCTVDHTSSMGDKTQHEAGQLWATFARPKSAPASVRTFKVAIKQGDVDAEWAFDGKMAYKLDHAAKTFASMEAPDGKAFPVQAASAIMPPWIFGSDVLSNPGAKLVGAKLLPDAKMDGVNCKVVEYRVEMSNPAPADDEKAEPLKMTMVQVRHVGADDLIARKIESRTTWTGGSETPEGRTFTGVYSKVIVNGKPGPGAFVLETKPGYTTAKAKASDLGIPSDEEPSLKFAVGDAAPAFALKTPDGAEVTLASLKGRVVLLDFWATWCGPCKKAMPSVQALHEKYSGKSVSIYGVNTWERGSASGPAKYMADKKFTYGLLMDGDKLAAAYGITGIPTFVLIGPDGKILHIGVGFQAGEEEKIAAQIDKALKS